MGDSLEQVRSFPARARQRIGFELWEIQQGKPPSDWKPMAPVGPGIQELRVQAGSAFRVIYIATMPAAVYVLHAFEKKSRKSAKHDIDLARARFKTLMQERRR